MMWYYSVQPMVARHQGGTNIVPERIEREVLIDAPPEVVWSVVTDPRHVGGWFSDTAEIDLRPGGEAILTWEEHGTAYGRVERVERPRFVSFRWMREMGRPLPVDEFGEGNSTLVEFTLSAEGDRTRLRVVESGFRELDGPEKENAKYAEENRRGWELELGELREYVSKRVRGSAR
jgi:uncharacterized protein YndB with AHSA1/START domain